MFYATPQLVKLVWVVLRGELAGKYESWGGLGDHQLAASSESLRREGKTLLSWESAPTQLPGGGCV